MKMLPRYVCQRTEGGVRRGVERGRTEARGACARCLANQTAAWSHNECVYRDVCMHLYMHAIRTYQVGLVVERHEVEGRVGARDAGREEHDQHLRKARYIHRGRRGVSKGYTAHRPQHGDVGAAGLSCAGSPQVWPVVNGWCA